MNGRRRFFGDLFKTGAALAALPVAGKIAEATPLEPTIVVPAHDPTLTPELLTQRAEAMASLFRKPAPVPVQLYFNASSGYLCPSTSATYSNWESTSCYRPPPRILSSNSTGWD